MVMENDAPVEVPVMFDFEKSLWDNVVLDLMRAGTLAVDASREATDIIVARRKLFNNQGEA